MQRLANAAQEKLGEKIENDTQPLMSPIPQQSDALADETAENAESEDDVISSYSDEELRRKMDLADKEQLKEYKKSLKREYEKSQKKRLYV